MHVHWISCQLDIVATEVIMTKFSKLKCLDKNAPSSIMQKRKEIDAFQRKPEQRDKGLNVKNRSSTDAS